MKPILVFHRFGQLRLSSIGALTACSLAFLAPAVRGVSILSNGSFESPNLSGSPDNYYTIVPTDWTASFGGIVKGAGGGLFPYTPPLPEDGNQYSLNGTGGNWIQQAFTIATGGAYELTWFDNTIYDATPSTPKTAYKVFVYDSLNVPVGSANLGPFTGGTTWNARSLAMTLAPGNYRLYFANDATATGDHYALDNVSLDAVASTSVPDTGSTVGLLSLAFGGMTLFAKKRRTEAGEAGLNPNVSQT